MEDHILSQKQFLVLLFGYYDNNQDDNDGYDKEWPPYSDTWLSPNLWTEWWAEGWFLSLN